MFASASPLIQAPLTMQLLGSFSVLVHSYWPQDTSFNYLSHAKDYFFIKTKHVIAALHPLFECHLTNKKYLE